MFRKSIMLIAVCLVLLPVARVMAVDLPPAAQDVCQQFAKFLDDGQYKESFVLTAPLLQKDETPDLWHGRIVSERESMGEVKSRTLIGAEMVTKVGDLPEGEYLAVSYKTEFAAHPDSTELFFLVPVEGGYGLVHYKISYNRWPEAIRIILNGLFIVFFIMILLAFLTEGIGRVVQRYEKSRKAANGK